MEKKINLLCLSFAGGNKYSYRALFDKAPSFLNVITFEYPGRGAKIKERLISDLEILVNELYAEASEIADRGKYAIYGHSLGGLVAYLLTVKLKENHHRLPEHIFVTGTSGPSSSSRQEKKRSLLPKDEFIQEIKDLGGMPDEILASEELLNYLEPILRNDFRVSETYLYEERSPMNIPMTVITGSEEDMEKDDVLLWQKESDLPVDFREMPGGHFFILEHTDKLIKIITEKLRKHIIYC